MIYKIDRQKKEFGTFKPKFRHERRVALLKKSV